MSFPAQRTPQEQALAEGAAKALGEVFPTMKTRALEVVLTQHTPAEAEKFVEAGMLDPAKPRERVEVCRVVLAAAAVRRRDEEAARIRAGKVTQPVDLPLETLDEAPAAHLVVENGVATNLETGETMPVTFKPVEPDDEPTVLAE